MKFNLVITFACLLSIQGMAQIQITESDLPNAGEAWEMVDVNPAALSLPALGANQAWNYTNAMSAHTDSTTLQFAAPSVLPGHQHFPQASLGYTTPLVPGFALFFSKNSQGLFIHGSYYPESPNDFYNVTAAAPPEWVVPCGLSFGQTVTSNSRSISFDSLSSSTTIKNVNHTRNIYKNVGYGVCSTPGFQQVPCLLISQTTIHSDSNYASQNGVSGPFNLEGFSTRHNHSYIFLKKGPNVMMATVDYDSLTGAVTSATYSRAGITAVAKQQGAQKQLTLFPNPATDRITVQLNEPIATLSVSDTQGRTVLEITNPSGELEVSSLPPGIFTVRARTDSRVYVQKLVKE